MAQPLVIPSISATPEYQGRELGAVGGAQLGLAPAILDQPDRADQVLEHGIAERGADGAPAHRREHGDHDQHRQQQQPDPLDRSLAPRSARSHGRDTESTGPAKGLET